MADVPRYVVDASVASKWHLNDEAYVPQALALLGELRANRVQLLAPDLIRHEAAGAIVGALQHQPPRLAIEHAIVSIREIRNWGIQLVFQDDLQPLAAVLARRWRCSYYDSVYLALALTVNCPLIYADSRMHRNLGGRLPMAIWIEDHQPVGQERSPG